LLGLWCGCTIFDPRGTVGIYSEESCGSLLEATSMLNLRNRNEMSLTIRKIHLVGMTLGLGFKGQTCSRWQEDGGRPAEKGKTGDRLCKAVMSCDL